MSVLPRTLSSGRTAISRLGALAGQGPAESFPCSIGRLLVLALLAAGLAGFSLLWTIGPHDEGLMLAAGSRIASGQWPYRDFWTNYPPGQALVLAGLDKLFGVSLLSWRVLGLAVDAGVSLLAYRLARRVAPERYALLAWVAAAGAMAFPTGPGPNPPALMLALAALLAAPRHWRLAGVLAGVAVLFRLEIGAAAVLGVMLAAPPGRRLVTGTLGAGSGLALLAPFFVVAPGAMWHDTVGFLGIQGLQRLPLPVAFDGPLRPSKLIEFYIPLILLAGSALWLAATVLASVRGIRSPRSRRLQARWLLGQPGRRLAIPLTRDWIDRDGASLAPAPLALVGVLYLLGRSDEFHLVPLSVVLAVLLAGAAAGARQTALRLALLAALALIAVHGLERRAGQALHPPALAAVPGPAGDGVQTTPGDAAALRGLLAEVDRVTLPGEAIFVTDPRTDRVTAGDSLLYVILSRPDATRYDVMQPGVVTTAPVQREIVRALARVRVVVRWLDPRSIAIEPNGSGRSSGVHILDRYLAREFAPVARFGYYLVLGRRGARGVAGA